MVCSCLWSMETATLKIDIVESLIKVLPQEHEAKILDVNTMDKTLMAIPDLFFLDLIRVPAYEARLHSLRVMHTYGEIVPLLKERIFRA